MRKNVNRAAAAIMVAAIVALSASAIIFHQTKWYYDPADVVWSPDLAARLRIIGTILAIAGVGLAAFDPLVHWLKTLSTAAAVRLMAATTCVLLIIAAIGPACLEELQRGKSVLIREQPELHGGLLFESEAPVFMHPGDSTVLAIQVDYPEAMRIAPICTLFAPGFETVPVRRRSTWQMWHDPFNRGNAKQKMLEVSCTWAVAPKHEGTQVLAFTIGANGDVITNVRSLSVHDFPLNLSNLTGALGLASGALAIYLLASGKRSESTTPEKIEVEQPVIKRSERRPDDDEPSA